MSKHTRQNQFHGSTGRPAPPKGGVANVTARHTIGAYECWCQGEACWTDDEGRTVWPGKEQGEPHPSAQEIEETKMVVMMEALDRADVKNYPPKVQDILLTLVNQCGIRCRLITGTEMLLYPPDGRSRPFKVLSRRGEKAAMGFIERQFIAQYGIEIPKKKKEQPVGEPTITFTEAKPVVEVPPIPAPGFSAKDGSVTEPEEEQAVETETIEPQKVWRQAYSSDGSTPLENWETDGEVFRCVLCWQADKEVTFDRTIQLGGHVRSVHRGTHPIHMPGALQKRSETVARKNMTKKITAAIEILQDAAGITPEAGEIERLKAEVEKERKRADEAEARLALAREAMGL